MILSEIPACYAHAQNVLMLHVGPANLRLFGTFVPIRTPEWNSCPDSHTTSLVSLVDVFFCPFSACFDSSTVSVFGRLFVSF